MPGSPAMAGPWPIDLTSHLCFNFLVCYMWREWLFTSMDLLILPKGGVGTPLIGQHEKEAEPVGLAPQAVLFRSVGRVHPGLSSGTRWASGRQPISCSVCGWWGSQILGCSKRRPILAIDISNVFQIPLFTNSKAILWPLSF